MKVEQGNDMFLKEKALVGVWPNVFLLHCYYKLPLGLHALL